MVRGVRTECSVDPFSDKTPALCWLILEPPRRSAKPRRNRRVNGDNRRPRPGTDIRVYPHHHQTPIINAGSIVQRGLRLPEGASLSLSASEPESLSLSLCSVC